MRLVPTIVLAAFMSPGALGTPVGDLRDGQNLSFDLLGLTYTYSGFMSGSGVVTDPDAPATCVAKNPGTLTMTVDLADLGAPFSVLVTLTGTEVNGTTVRWNTNTLVNQCVTVTVDGQTVDVLVKRVVGQFTATVGSVPTFFEPTCGRSYNVRFDDVGGDAQSFIDIESYALCIELSFFRIDFAMRSIDVQGFGGIHCPGDTNGDRVIDFADVNNVLSVYNQVGQGLPGDVNGDGVVNFDDLNIVVGNFNLSC
jgi:hypothetical protein